MSTAAFTGCFDSRHVAGQFVERWRVWPFSKDRVPLFTFRNDADNPLTFTDRDGNRWRPNRTFDKFDFASVPLLLQGVVSAVAMPCSAALHDSGYEFGGLWQVRDDGSEVFVVMDRARVDELGMRQAVACETGSDYVACKCYAAVRLGGGSTWASHDRAGQNLGRAEQMVISGQMPLSNL